MKKLWIVLLSVALIMAFAMPVCAADVKFSGSYVAQGYYDNNRTLVTNGGASVSNVWQRLRLQADIKVQEGLSLTTRADILEKVWGATRSTSVNGVSVNWHQRGRCRIREHQVHACVCERQYLRWSLESWLPDAGEVWHRLR